MRCARCPCEAKRRYLVTLSMKFRNMNGTEVRTLLPPLRELGSAVRGDFDPGISSRLCIYKTSEISGLKLIFLTHKSSCSLAEGFPHILLRHENGLLLGHSITSHTSSLLWGALESDPTGGIMSSMDPISRYALHTIWISWIVSMCGDRPP